MTRKTGFLIVLFVVLLVVGGYLYMMPPSSEVSIKKEVDPELEPFVEDIKEIKELSKTEPEKAEENGEALLAQLPEKYKRYIEFGFDSAIAPVAFYGKIVDQYGEPVEGAKVGYMVHGRFLARGKGYGYAQTDGQGRFEIHGEGANIELTGVKHPNINFRFPENASGARYGSAIARMTFYDVSPEMGRTVPLLSDTSQEKPYVFTAWRVEKYEQVIIGSESLYIPPDGRTYTIDFNEKQDIHRFIREGLSEGHLRISCEREPMKDYGDRVNWKIILEPVAGGIQQTDDLYLNLAPESGYQRSLTIKMQKGSPDYKPELTEQRYFFTANNGQIYGSLFVSIMPHSKLDRCRFAVREFKINSNASRNLALKSRR